LIFLFRSCDPIKARRGTSVDRDGPRTRPSGVDTTGTAAASINATRGGET
jgi:hypothetical protein